MILNKKHCLLFLALFVIMLTTISMVSAANADTNSKQEITDNTELSTPSNNDVDKVVQAEVTKTGSVADVETIISDKTNNNTKTITKNIQIQTAKQETEPISVNNYADFKSALVSDTYSDITITLENDIVSDSAITVNSAIKNLVIEGNEKTIDGNAKAFLTVNNMNLTIKNVIITNCIANNNAVLYATNSNVTILDSTISNSQSTATSNAIVFNVASGKAILNGSVFKGNKINSRTTGFIISVPQTSVIINNDFIDNVNIDSVINYKYDSLLKSAVTEIHDNNYIGNYIGVEYDFSELDINAHQQLDVYDDVVLPIHMYVKRNDVYNTTVKSGRIDAEYVARGIINSFQVNDGLALISLTYSDIKNYHYDYTDFTNLDLTYVSEDNSYEGDTTDIILIPKSTSRPSLTATVNPTSGHMGDSFTISGTLTNSGSVLVGNTVTLTLNNGYTDTAIVNATGYVFNYTPDALGTYTATITVAKHGGISNAQTKTVTFRVDGDPSYISINTNVTEVTGAQPVKVYGVLTDKDGLPIGGATVNLTYKNVYKDSTITDLETGEYSFDYVTDVADATSNNLKVAYGGNNELGINATSNSTTLTVNAFKTNITFSATDTQYGGQTKVTGFVYDVETGEHIQSGQVSIKFTGVNNAVTANIVDGTFEYLQSYTNVGTKTANATFIASGLYGSSTNTTEFTVTKGITNITINTNGPIKVGSSLTVSGYLLNDFGNYIGSRVYVNVSLGSQKSNPRTANTGSYTATFTVNEAGDYDIIVEWEGNTNYFNCKNTTTISVYKIPTITNVTVVNDIKDNVTIDVVVTENDTTFKDIIKSGTIKVTVGEKSKTYPISSSGTTRIALDGDVNITTTDTVDFTVEFVESAVDLNSIGINSSTGETITKFTARPVSSRITVDVKPVPQNITSNVTISGEVYDEFDNFVEEGIVTIDIENTDPIEVPFAEGRYEYNFTTVTGGNITFNVTFNASKTESGSILIQESKNSSYFVVEKLPTITNWEILNTSYGNVTVRINVTSTADVDNFVSTGTVYVYEFISGRLIKDNIDVSGKSVDIILPLEPGVNKLLIDYPENHIYLESNARNESHWNTFEQDVIAINVDKLPSISNVEEILNNKSGEVALRINVTNTTGSLLPDGHVVVVNATDGKQLGEGDLVDGKVDILLADVTEPGVIEVNVTFMGNDYYLASNATGYNKQSGDNVTVITVIVDSEINIQLSENEVSINEPVTISGGMFNSIHATPIDGGKVVVNINGTPLDAEFDHATGEYSINYVPENSGVYTINASYYDENDQLVVTSENEYLTVNKIESSTDVTILNSTAGNVTLNISVAGIDGNKTMTGNVNIIIDGNIIVPVELTGEETVTVELKDNIARSGSISVTVEFTGNDIYYPSTAATDVLDVQNQTPVLTVDVDEKDVVNSTVAVITGTLTDDLGNSLPDAYVEILVDNIPAGIVKTDSEGEFTFEYTADKLGEIIVNASYAGDNKRYSNASGDTSFNVYKLNTTVELEVSDIDYAQTELLNITVNETDVAGEISIEVTGPDYSYTTTLSFSGEVIQIPLTDLKSGDYTVTLTYSGDSKYEGNTTSGSFTVSTTGDYILAVDAQNITYGESEIITVTLPDDATGFATVSIEGTDIQKQVHVTDSQAILVIDAYELPADEYTVNVEFSDSNYALITNTTTFKVSKAASSVSVNAENITAGYDEIITVTLPEYEHADGNISVRITGEDYLNEFVIESQELDEGTISKVIEGLAAGTYDVEILFTNDTNYDDSTSTAQFKVELPEIVIYDSETIFVDESVLVHGIITDINANEETGTVRLNINGTARDIAYDEYVKGITLDFSEEGVYTVNATYILNDEEIVTSDNIIITINRIPTVTTVNVINNTLGNVLIDVTVRENATGYTSIITSGKINVTIDGETQQYDIQGANTTILLDHITTAGDKNVQVVYNGSTKYVDSTGRDYTSIDSYFETVHVEPKSSMITIDDIESVAINDTVTITGQVFDEYGSIIESGEVSVKVNEQPAQTVPITDGRYTLTGNKNTTQAGQIKVEVTYNGETDITKPSANETTYTVTKIPTTTKVELTDSTSGSVTVNVKVETANSEVTQGTLNISVAGITATVNIEDAADGNIILSDIPEFAGLLESGNVSVQVTFNENDYYLSSTDETFKNITVTNKDLELDVDANETSAVLDQSVTINGTLITEDNLEGKTVFLNITGKDVLIPVTVNSTNGFTYEYVADTIGTINVKASFTDDTGIYSNASDEATFTVGKIPTKTEVSFAETTIGNAVVNVKVTSNDESQPTGHVIIVDSTTGEVLGEDDLVNGERDITLDVITTGPLSVNATYIENDKYLSSNNTAGTSIAKLESSITINIVDDSLTVGDTVVIYGTVTDSTSKVIASGTVTVTINGTNYNTTVTNGEYKLENITDTAGTFKVNATFAGNDNVTAKTSTTEEFTVSKKNTKTSITVKDTAVGSTSIDVSVTDNNNNPVTTGTLKITTPNESFTVPVNTPITNIALKTTDNTALPVTVEYQENTKYNSSTTTEEITVTKVDTTITVNVTTPVKAGEEAIISGILVDENNKPVTDAAIGIKVDGKETANVTTDKDGKYTAKLSDTIVGTHNIEAAFAGNNKYGESDDSASLTVEKLQSELTVNPIKDAAVGQNVEISGKLTDENNKPISNAQIKVSFDGKTTTVTTDSNGNYKASYPTITAGEKEISVSYTGNDKYDASQVDDTSKVTKANAEVKVNLPVDAKIGEPASITGKVTDENGKPVPNTPVNVTVNGKTIKTVTDKDGNFEVEANNIAEGINSITVKAGNENYDAKDATGKFTATRKDAKLSLDPINDPKLKDNVTITGKLVDEQNKPISYAPVQVTVNGETTTVTTDANGNYKLPVSNMLEGTNNISVKYENPLYKTQTNTTAFNASKSKTIVTVPSIVGIIGEDITLTAYVTDQDGNPVTGGNLVFKLNGRTLRTDGRFDTNDTSPLKLSVVNGVVTYTIKADLYLRNGKNITASYSGSSKYEEAKANIAEANIKKRTAQVTVKVTPNSTRQNNDIVFTATLSDVTPNGTNTTSLTTDANIIFKVNGVTIKNSTGKANRINVDHSVINYVYHVPTGMGGVDSNGVKDYAVEAVYDNPVFYPDTRNSSVFHVQRSKVNINFISTSVKNNVLSVKANFTDFEDKYLVGTSNVCVKINGVTYKENGETKYFTVKDGKVDLTNIKLANGTKVKSVMLVTGAREGYLGARETTTDIITA